MEATAGFKESTILKPKPEKSCAVRGQGTAVRILKRTCEWPNTKIGMKHWSKLMPGWI